ncbi:hypothetical protein KAFR_0G00680 [Kazachstania africana CBS 2517]|uniref:GTP-binding protein RHO4 n=1 Tax=Kazachstania africana (strain ATCC 22294 / BCRC 22015 / CBS 2517 / CECT 1963 / NBRC 1671 / NRRL Y-8276) TaxID=1071382 RepID=H2AXK1_KAZAF|nr:hypothetical protein KAFR_0G00680 [Kazachstania africana CBS 2517]CCF59101.1 hypothetical protein KAFR_0G00680 [Kazachstania africana CBS 2517]
MNLETVEEGPQLGDSHGLLGQRGYFNGLPYSESMSTSVDEKSTRRLPYAFDRSLSNVVSYENMKRNNRLADFRVKLVVVGDGAVGKTCLLMSYVQKTFPEDYIPTVFENYVTKIAGPKGKYIELALWDTAGQEEYSRLRPLSYTDVDILMVCYSVDNKVSLQNVRDQWFPEVKHFCGDTPIMLVGLKSDLYAQDNIDDLVDPKEADILAKKLGAFVHIQCSAKTRQNIDDVFSTAITSLLPDDLSSSQKRGGVSLITRKIKRMSTSKKPSLEIVPSDEEITGLERKKKFRTHKCVTF